MTVDLVPDAAPPHTFYVGKFRMGYERGDRVEIVRREAWGVRCDRCFAAPPDLKAKSEGDSGFEYVCRWCLTPKEQAHLFARS